MTIHVGIDPGKDTHSVSFLTEGRDSNHCLTIANDRDGYHQLLDRLTAYQRSGDRVELAIEPSGHYWENLGFFLAKQGYDLKLVNPFHVSRYTEILDNSPTKTDRKDSHLIAILLREGHALHSNLPQGSYAEVRRFTELRRDALQDLRKLRSKLHVWVDRYFPEYLCLFSDLAGATSLGILAKYGCPQRIVEVTVAQLSRDLKELSRGKLGKARALKLQERAARSVGQTVAYRAAQVELQLLIEKFQQNREELKLVEQQLRLLLEELPEAGLLQTIPGVGWWGAAVFLGEMGPVERYRGGRSVEKLAGLNLSEHSSGTQLGERHISRRGRSGLRQVAYQLALGGIRNNEEFRLFYERKLLRGSSKVSALVALGAKVLRVMYGVVKSGQGYRPLDVRQMEYENSGAGRRNADLTSLRGPSG